MAESQQKYIGTNAYKNEKRNQSRMVTREALFIHEYVKTKYVNIYHEAAGFYNQINKQYSKKPDLRKTYQFRSWKNQVAAQKGQPQTNIPRPKEYYYNRTQYKDITICPPTETSQKKCNTNNLLTMMLNIPLMATPQHSTTEGIITQEDQSPDPPAVSTEVIQENDQAATPTIDEDLMLIDPSITDHLMPEIVEKITQEDQSPDPPAVSTEVIQENDQAATPTIDEDLMLIDPSITDHLMPEIVEKIISELQADPNIKDLIDGIDNFQQELPESNEPLEVEIPELEIDLPELNGPLEESVFW